MMKVILVVIVAVLVAGSYAGKSTTPNSDGTAPGNTCTTYAQTKDLSTAGLVSTLSSQCNILFGATPAAVAANADSEPYKLCLVAGDTARSNLQPQDDESIVATDSFNNTTPQTVSHEFTLEGQFINSIKLSTTSSVAFSASVNFNVDVMPTWSLKFDLNTSFSSSKASTQFSQAEVQYQSSTSVNCSPDCDYTAALNVQTSVYKSQFTVPICLSGWVRCQYNSKQNGHYYWYFLVEDFIADTQRCIAQNGELDSSVSIDSTTTLSNHCY